MVNYKKYLKAVLKDIRIYKNSNGSVDHKTIDIFNDWHSGYCSMRRYDAIATDDDHKDIIDEIYMEVFGHTRTELMDIARRMSPDLTGATT